MTTVLLLYHFFHPDDVISARLYSDLAVSLSQKGLEVIACPSTRSCHLSGHTFGNKEKWAGGEIQRIWRPNLKQSSSVGRLLNTFFMLLGWSWKALMLKRTTDGETVIIGTDPIFGILAAIPWRIFRPRTRIIHWCHDVHPEATLADGGYSRNSLVVRTLRAILRIAYKRCDVVVDLGSCMRALLIKEIGTSERTPVLQTITPWSLIEPNAVAVVDPVVRQELFGNCQLALLYSGNLGRAHEVDSFIALARACRSDGIHFCFAGRGLGIEQLRSKLSSEDTNVYLAGFTDECELQARLSACDIHLVSLKPSWTGTVVPSKFFGALAIGRPVLFSGAVDSSLSKCIREHEVGWHLSPSSIMETRRSLIEYKNDVRRMTQLNLHCWETYKATFSKSVQLEKWLTLIASVHQIEGRHE